jgi:glycosyltransferase involved in cell wall biosynthesis
MRIIIVSQEYPPETAKGGIGTQALMKAHGLAARGHDVTVISRAPDHQRSERVDAGCRLIRIPGFERRLPLHTEIADWLTYSAEVAVAIGEVHAAKPVDLVEFPEWACEGYVHLMNRTEWNTIPSVIHLHGPLVMFGHTMGWPELTSTFFKIGTEMEGTCLRAADAIYASSCCSADWCAREYGLVRDAIPILHTGVDTTMFFPRPVPRDSRPTVLFVGKLVRNKGVIPLTEAVCGLADDLPDIRLQLIGRQDDQVVATMRAIATKSGHADVLDIVGPVMREHLADYYSRAHVFAAPSQYEGGPGFVYLEAMACGLPVIACSASGASEIVLPGVNGMLVPPEDPVALCETLRHLFANPLERETMGRSAREYVSRHADSHLCIDRIEKFYHLVARR